MEFETRKRNIPVINLTALIDIVFILVIFVVLGANFHHIETLDVSVPSVESSTGKINPDSLIITIPVSGPIVIQNEKVEPDKIKTVLQSLRPRFNSILLMADQSASIQRAVKILSEAQAAGFSSVSVATQKPDEHVP